MTENVGGEKCLFFTEQKWAGHWLEARNCGEGGEFCGFQG